MSGVLQAGSVEGICSLMSAVTFLLDSVRLKSILDFQFSSPTVVPLTSSPVALFVRSDWKDKHRKIKVFGTKGVQLYTFERLSRFNPVWTLKTFPHRHEIATIDVGVLSSSFDFHNKSQLTHRDIKTELGIGQYSRSFYLTDGVKYNWSHSSKFLEKILNPNGGSEEVRQRVAKVKLMRQFKFDFELLVDVEKVDLEVALVTAFVSMLTQWGVGEYTNTVGPTYIEPRAETNVALDQAETPQNKITVEIVEE
jgi:hypothetical protein